MTRLSDSPLIRRVVVHHHSDGKSGVAMPDGARDLVVIKYEDHVRVMLTGNITQPIPLQFPEGTEVMNILFDPSTVVTQSDLTAVKMLDRSIDLPIEGKNKIRIGDETLEIPSFETAENFAEAMSRKGLLYRDSLVADLVVGKSINVTERTVQRRFRYATGLTYKYFTQMERAWKAASLLQMGRPALEVAFALGFTDQSHMIKSLKSILGKTPTQIRNSEPFE